MTEAQARGIWEFVDRHKAEVGAFVVHCHQGMSRSPAVVAGTAADLGLDDRTFWQNYMPNRHAHEIVRSRQRKIDDLNPLGRRKPFPNDDLRTAILYIISNICFSISKKSCAFVRNRARNRVFDLEMRVESGAG